MPIINGKKRYIPEAAPKPAAENKRYVPVEDNTPPAPVKRYIKGGSQSDSNNKDSTKKYVKGYEFEVRIDLIKISFHKIINLGGEIETETFVEGGSNMTPVIRQKPRQRRETIIFEKGLTEDAGTDFFTLLRQGMKITNILIFVRLNGKIVRIFSIDEGLIVSKKYTELDANSSTLLIERLELAHSGISDVPLP